MEFKKDGINITLSADRFYFEDLNFRSKNPIKNNNKLNVVPLHIIKHN
jgi:hypothetical protein